MVKGIEFFLHPPSPGKCTLPPVSSLLKGNKNAIGGEHEEARDEDTTTELLPLLCLPSPSLSSSSSVILEPIEPSPCHSPSLSPLMNSLSISDSSAHNNFLSLPPPTDTRRSRSLSNASSTSSLLSTSDDTTKRKRGRPPNSTSQRESWTFVTPTVWDVHEQKDEKLAYQQQPAEGNKVLLNWSTPSINHKIKDQHMFTNTNLDCALTIPKKKRGRKPKKQLAGNFCFVWRDLTAKRGVNKKKKKVLRV